MARLGSCTARKNEVFQNPEKTAPQPGGRRAAGLGLVVAGHGGDDVGSGHAILIAPNTGAGFDARQNVVIDSRWPSDLTYAMDFRGQVIKFIVCRLVIGARRPFDFRPVGPK